MLPSNCRLGATRSVSVSAGKWPPSNSSSAFFVGRVPTVHWSPSNTAGMCRRRRCCCCDVAVASEGPAGEGTTVPAAPAPAANKLKALPTMERQGKSERLAALPPSSSATIPSLADHTTFSHSLCSVSPTPTQTQHTRTHRQRIPPLPQ